MEKQNIEFTKITYDPQHKNPPKIITTNQTVKLRRWGGHFCKRTHRLGEHHLFGQRARTDPPFAGTIVGSFRCFMGGGYLVRRDKDGKIVQAYYIIG